MSMLMSTRGIVEAWATRSNVSLDKLNIDKVREDASPGDSDFYLPNTVEIEIIYDGSVDEEFCIDELYAVNVVDDCLVPDLIAHAAKSDSPEWTVYVRRVSGEHGDYAEAEHLFERTGDGSGVTEALGDR
jgi:hypothetical protein